MKQQSCRNGCFHKLNQFSQDIIVEDAHASNADIFLSRDTSVILISWIGLFGQNELFSTLKTLFFRKYSFQKLTNFSQKNNMLDSEASNQRVFFGEIHEFLKVSWMCPFAAYTAYFLLKHLRYRLYYFKKLTKFSQWNNVLDAAAAYIDGFFGRDTWVS
jgi:hypothetical protein